MPYRRWFRLWSYRLSGRLPAASSTDMATRLLVPRDRAISAVITKDRGNDLIDVAATTRGRLRAGPIVREWRRGIRGERSMGTMRTFTPRDLAASPTETPPSSRPGDRSPSMRQPLLVAGGV